MEMFWADLKTLLSLILPIQYCYVKNQGRFLGYIISLATPTPSMSLLYSTIVLYDVHSNTVKPINYHKSVQDTCTLYKIEICSVQHHVYTVIEKGVDVRYTLYTHNYSCLSMNYGYRQILEVGLH